MLIVCVARKLPIVNFESVSQYAEVHSNATVYDFKRELEVIEWYNETWPLRWRIDLRPFLNPNQHSPQSHHRELRSNDIPQDPHPPNSLTTPKTDRRPHENLLATFKTRYRLTHDAWVIAAPPPDDKSAGYVFRIDVGNDPAFLSLLPTIGEPCHLIIDDGHKGSRAYNAKRSAGCVKLSSNWDATQEYTVFKLDKLASKEPWSGILRPIVPPNADPSNIQVNRKAAIKVKIQLKVSRTTFNAEMGALNHLTRPIDGAGFRQRTAFAHLVLPQEIRKYVDITTSFPHLRNPGLVTDKDIRDNLNRMYNFFDTDQRSAFRRLACIPDGIFFLPGAAGSGKTSFALAIAAMVQAAGSAKVLFLIDINKPLDDTASKMIRLYKTLGLRKKVIRMLKWPRELAKGSFRDIGDSDNFSAQAEPDATPEEDDGKRNFGSAFIDQWRRAATTSRAKGEFEALTLDEAACEYYLNNKKEYSKIGKFIDQSLEKLKTAGEKLVATSQCEADILGIYRIVLQEADFIATTPVAAFCHFDGMFDPDLVFFDECAHARELSTLISIAFFEPKAWVFLGDHRQTNPHTTTEHNASRQLELSMIERIAHTHNIQVDLLINHRSYGELQGLPSKLFYDGKMRSGRARDGNFPESVMHLRDYFSQFRKENARYPHSDVPRFIIYLRTAWRSLVRKDKDGQKEHDRKLYWNPANHAWVMRRVEELLNDTKFRRVDGSGPGTILIMSPYREAFHKYEGAIRRIARPGDRERVKARTCGTVQGAQADVVFLDMVMERATPHTDDEKRLCVALTRACQAEVILMHPGMRNGNSRWDPELLPRIWDNCESGEEGSIIKI